MTITQGDFDHAMNLLLGSVLFGVRYAAPIMKEQGGGSIISNASIAGLRSHMGGYLYSIAKAAVAHSARIAAVQLGVHNIRVNTISPGSIATPIFLGGSDIAAGLDADKTAAKMAKLEGNLARANPLHTSGFPKDIAMGALYLASDDSRFVTGHDLVIDGGMVAGGRTNFEDLRPGSAT
jgi:NAD(P)-dependent dehydrogenase (short-subunit alcohol dehydrogenase family)